MTDIALSLLAPYGVIDIADFDDSAGESAQTALARAACGRYPELYSIESPVKTLLAGSEDDPYELSDEWFLVFVVMLLLDSGPTAEIATALENKAQDAAVERQARTMFGLIGSAAYAAMGEPEKALSVAKRIRETLFEGQLHPSYLSLLVDNQYSLRLAETVRYSEAQEIALVARELLRRVWPDIQQTSGSNIEQRVLAALDLSFETNLRSLERVQSADPRFEGRINEDDFRSGRESWRSLDRRLGSTLDSLTEELFRQRVTEATQTSRTFFARTDEVNRGAGEGWLTSNIYGDWSRSRRAARNWGMLKLARADVEDDSEVELALNLIYNSGSAKDLKSALRTVKASGPLAPASAIVSRTANQVLRNQADRSQSPTRAELTVLEQCGSLLDQETLDRTTVALLDSRDTVAKRDWLGFYRYDFLLWDTLESLSYCVVEARDVLLLAITESLDQADGLTARNMARILARISFDSIDVEIEERLTNWAIRYLGDSASAAASAVLYRRAYLGDSAAKQALIERWNTDRSLSVAADLANLAWYDRSSMTSDIASAIIELAVSQMNEARTQAAAGSFAFGGIDPCHVAALMSAGYPGAANWEAVQAYLFDPKIALTQKEQTLDWLAEHPESLPADFVSAASRNLDRIFAGTDDWFGPGAAEGPALRFACGINALTSSRSVAIFLELAGSDEASNRAQAARSARFVARTSSADLAGGVIHQMLRDDVLAVRTEVARQLASMLSMTTASTRASLEQSLVRCLRSDGVNIPHFAMRGIYASVDEVPQEALARLAAEIRELSSSSASLAVRGAANSVLGKLQLTHAGPDVSE